MQQVPEFLLDTSALQAVGSHVLSLASQDPDRVILKASYYAPFELLAAIAKPNSPEKAAQVYREKRAALKKYATYIGKDNTYWHRPSDIAAGAFGLPVDDWDWSSFYRLVEACVTCETREELERAIGADQLMPKPMSTLQSLLQSDSRQVDGFRVALTDLQDLIRELRPKKIDLQGLQSRMLIVYAKLAVDWKNPTNKSDFQAWEQAMKLLPKYDGSLEFIRAIQSAYYEPFLIAPYGGPRKNDPLDLNHVCYMRAEDNSQQFITSDRKLRDLVNWVNSGRALLSRDFEVLFVEE